jgi:hypothetical protein
MSLISTQKIFDCVEVFGTGLLPRAHFQSICVCAGIRGPGLCDTETFSKDKLSGLDQNENLRSNLLLQVAGPQSDGGVRSEQIVELGRAVAGSDLRATTRRVVATATRGGKRLGEAEWDAMSKLSAERLPFALKHGKVNDLRKRRAAKESERASAAPAESNEPNKPVDENKPPPADKQPSDEGQPLPTESAEATQSNNSNQQSSTNA